MIKEDNIKKKHRNSLGNAKTINQKSLPQDPENQKTTSNKDLTNYINTDNTSIKVKKNNTNNSIKVDKNPKINDNSARKSEADLQKQLLEIKKLLDQTQQELAKSKCRSAPVNQNSKYKADNNQVEHGASCSLPPEE